MTLFIMEFGKPPIIKKTYLLSLFLWRNDLVALLDFARSSLVGLIFLARVSGNFRLHLQFALSHFTLARRISN